MYENYCTPTAYVKDFFVRVKALSGELSYMLTGLVVSQETWRSKNGISVVVLSLLMSGS